MNGRDGFYLSGSFLPQGILDPNILLSLSQLLQQAQSPKRILVIQSKLRSMDHQDLDHFLGLLSIVSSHKILTIGSFSLLFLFLSMSSFFSLILVSMPRKDISRQYPQTE